MADPAFRGFVETTFDALLIFEGCRRGLLPKISRRLQEFEKRALVVSGAIFVFDEEETGIKRWTDGLSWSPSRTLSNFLVYRELDKKPGSRKGVPKDEPGEDEDDFDGSGKSKHAHRLMGGLTSKADPVEEEEPIAGSSKDDRPGSARPQSARKRTLSEAAASLQLDRARERALVGSLTSSARFRPDGLVKKTISLNGLHLIGYYRIEDVTSGRLRTPSSLPEIASLQIFHKFLLPSLFRVPPIVEMGPDGTLQYKGESDTPLSPISASSQGFPTPGMSQSRPGSSSDALSHFSALLPTPASGWDYGPPPPASPRRGATATFPRASSRYDPYSTSTRFASSQTQNASYPFPSIPSAPQQHQQQQQQSRSTFPTIGEGDSEGAYQARTPPIEQLSTSAPSSQGWHGTHGGAAGLYQSLPASRGGYVAQDQVPHSPSFYQPVRPTPYAPTSEASTSAALFAYNPPPPTQPLPPQSLYQAPGTAGTASGSPSLGSVAYQAYQLPPGYGQQRQAHQQFGASQQYQPLYSPQFSSQPSDSNPPFATPPSTAQPRSAYGQQQSSQPQQPLNLGPPTSSHSQSSSQPLPSPAFHSNLGWLGPQLPRQQSLDSASSLAQQAAALMVESLPHSPADPNASMVSQQQQYLPQYDYLQQQPPQPQQQQPFSYSQPQPSTSQPLQSQQHLSSSTIYAFAPTHASGMVGIASDEVVPASGHGLGVRASYAGSGSGSGSGGVAGGEAGPSSIGRRHSFAPASSTSQHQQLSYGAHAHPQSASGLRQPPPPLPSVSLSHQNVYASTRSPNTQPQQLQQSQQQQQAPLLQRYGSPLDSHLASLLERDQRGSGGGGGGGGGGSGGGGSIGEWGQYVPPQQQQHQPQPARQQQQSQQPRGIKRDADDDLSCQQQLQQQQQQPMSPPRHQSSFSPRLQQHLPPSAQQQHQQQQHQQQQQPPHQHQWWETGGQ